MNNQVVPDTMFGISSNLEVPWFARPVYTENCKPVYTEEEVEMYPLEPLNLKKENKFENQNLSKDPRLWSRDEVCSWVLHTCSNHNLPAPNTDRFLMNGKAVCLMSLNMFISRVPLGGKLLYRDFQIRLGRAIHN
ncbi:ets DNA-binding protein pokkuri [Eurytemora carolleeae]|uniref:ets DNA-binding protein pokkuri n=1 Tax=Eurytemora carolleeae TaxID=1294199 RepID=UPI000C77B39E|nr:ets DNA-binding protein pokkuri [Eurytemora carolleeae]|eukprot:XP_023347045.1 ets DNA-binding protein pokkuri-like [Eurytemora affinis]